MSPDHCQPAISKIDLYVTVVLNVVTDLYIMSIPLPVSQSTQQDSAGCVRPVSNTLRRCFGEPTSQSNVKSSSAVCSAGASSS